ncbi:MAG: ABC transporter permease [Sarcina sp.]
MNIFIANLNFGLKRRSKDFFLIIYNLLLPVILVAALGYLMSTDYQNTITSYQYYLVVLIPFFIALSTATALYNTKEDKIHNVSGRILSSPVSISNIVLPKILSATIILVLITALLLIISNFIFKMNLGVTLITLLLMYSSLIFLVTSLGYFIGFICKNEETIRNYMNLPVCIFAFMSGAFFPVGSINPVLDKILMLSPLRLINSVTFSAIYAGTTTNLYILAIIMFILGTLLSIASIKKFRKEAFI